MYLKHKSLIAVVDDDQSVREALENLINSVGLEVKLFASAEDFLDSDMPIQTDCAILDVCLPGMSGVELQQRLAADGKNLPVIIITAQGDDKTQGEAVAAGAIAFLKKPFKEEVLLVALQSALNRKAGDQSSQLAPTKELAT
ncbi:MAG TPA: response regulator [Pyrinomonadaceae bacterium]|nr:response regulator [Pyrinomonadaceae bacterium]